METNLWPKGNRVKWKRSEIGSVDQRTAKSIGKSKLNYSKLKRTAGAVRPRIQRIERRQRRNHKNEWETPKRVRRTENCAAELVKYSPSDAVESCQTCNLSRLGTHEIGPQGKRDLRTLIKNG